VVSSVTLSLTITGDHPFVDTGIGDGNSSGTWQKLCGNRTKWRLCEAGAEVDRWSVEQYSKKCTVCFEKMYVLF